MDFKFKCGLYIGRFQPLHIGHTSIIDWMLVECESVIIAVGSAQESGTERNPLPYPLRAQLIAATYRHKQPPMSVIPIFDRPIQSDDSSWGDYLVGRVHALCKSRPDVIYEGEEDAREHWYDNYGVPIIKVPRTEIPISGTELRNAILNDYRATASVYLPDVVYHEYYDLIRKELQYAAVNSKRNPLD